jgi:DNA invertase Pin-like site-specific DNA recombinase
MPVGYARVSTAQQSLALQQDALAAAACARTYTDVASGAVEDRDALAAAFDDVRAGDTLVVWRLDRLGRSLEQLIERVTALEARVVGFRSLTEARDTTTSGGRLIFHVFGPLAEFERAIIRERTLAGLAAARARGRLAGRPPALTPALTPALLADRTPARARCGVSPRARGMRADCRGGRARAPLGRATYSRVERPWADALPAVLLALAAHRVAHLGRSVVEVAALLGVDSDEDPARAPKRAVRADPRTRRALHRRSDSGGGPGVVRRSVLIAG